MSIVRLDKIKATAHIIAGVSKEDLLNGAFVAQGNLRSDGESYEVDKIKNLDTDIILFHASVPVMYETSAISEFVLKAGREGRNYSFEIGDIVTITDDIIDGKTKVGEFVVPQVGNYKGKATTTLTKETLALKVIAKETLGGENATVLQVVRA